MYACVSDEWSPAQADTWESRRASHNRKRPRASRGRGGADAALRAHVTPHSGRTEHDYAADEGGLSGAYRHAYGRGLDRARMGTNEPGPEPNSSKAVADSPRSSALERHVRGSTGR